MSRGPDAAVLLERALAASAGRARCPIRVTAAGSTRWASATFAGARHELTLAADPSPALDAWLAGLPTPNSRCAAISSPIWSSNRCAAWATRSPSRSRR
ncbi:MAG: hypothetical protein WDN44_10600 [Sphingomonas sp.]